MELLSEVDGEVYFVVLHASRQRRTLPPVLSPVHGEAGWMGFLRPRRITVVTHLSLDEVDVDIAVCVSPHQLAVELRPHDVLPAGGRGGDAPSLG